MKEKKKFKERTGIKFFAGLMAVLMFMLCFFSGDLTLICLQNNVFFDGGKEFLENEMLELANHAVQNLESSQRIIVQVDASGTASLIDRFGEPAGIVSPDENLQMEIYDMNGKIIWSSEKSPSLNPDRYQRILSSKKVFLTRYQDSSAESSKDIDGQPALIEGSTYIVNVYADLTPQELNSSYITIHAVEVISLFSKFFPAVFIICALILFACAVFIVCSSGHRAGTDGISTIWFDKIPFELFAAAIVIALVFGFSAYKFFTYDHVFTQFYNRRILEIAIGVGIIALIGILSVAVLFTLSARFKAKCFLKYTAIGYCIRLLIKFFRLITYLFSTLKQTWRSLLMMVAYSAVIIFGVGIAITQDAETGIVIIAAAIVSLAMLILLWSAGFEKLREYVKKIKNGELDSKIDRKFLFGNLISTADDLEGVGEGVKRAVDERMRSERLKTELITNVSHDLKTPLTSIVNYIDILSKDDIQDDTAIEHISVLQRQAAKMKKLIEDLIEVSKATSGNVAVNLERTDLNLLLTQCAAEYAEKFEAAELTPVLKIPDKKIIASLDGRLMWRVFDNLLGNVCKYALVGTRVYITADDLGDHALISFKNVSRYPLDLTAEDLMERFSRGDSSRSTEGSGLGLSIAKSLCDLQSVGFELIIDGDLFKVELSLLTCDDSDLLDDEVQDNGEDAIIDPGYGAEGSIAEDDEDNLTKAVEKPDLDSE